MVAGRLSPFGGMLPARDDTLLPDHAAAHSENTWLYNGLLRGIASPELIRACTAGTTKVYRIPNSAAVNPDQISDSVWMEFADSYTDVLRAPIVDDTFQRYYWVSPSEAPSYNTFARIENGDAGWLLGVPTPGAVTVTPSGGVASTTVTRSYAVTWVSAYGEEGAPSVSAATSGKTDDTWTVTLPIATFDDLGFTGGDRNLTKARIYRTITSTLGVSTYFLVAEVDIAYTVTRNGDTHSNTTVDDLSTTADLAVGFTVSGSGITPGTLIATIAGATSITIDTAAGTSLDNTALTFTNGGDLTYADTASDTVVSANNQLESTTWVPPPDDLEGWVQMGNGMIVGFRENELWFCEPYRPHAWPAAYALAVEYPIVGLGVANQTLVVATEGFPMTGAGVRPANFTLSKVPSLEPCTSRGSIASSPTGVFYTSPNGLIAIAQGAAVNTTRQLITKDRWQRVAPLHTVRAAWLGSAYYSYGTTLPGVFQEDTFQEDMVQQLDFTGALNGVLVDPTDERVAFNQLTTDTETTNVFSDPWTGEIFIIREDNLYRINLADNTPTREAYLWRSKIFQTREKGNLGALKIYFSVPANTPGQSTTRNTDAVQTLASDQYGLVRVYADDTLIMTREIRTSGELMRVPFNSRADYWQIELEGRVDIKSVQFASTPKELAKV